MTGLGMNIIHGPIKNPYRGLRPRTEPYQDDEFCYMNQELVISFGNVLKEQYNFNETENSNDDSRSNNHITTVINTGSAI